MSVINHSHFLTTARFHFSKLGSHLLECAMSLLSKWRRGIIRHQVTLKRHQGNNLTDEAVEYWENLQLRLRKIEGFIQISMENIKKITFNNKWPSRNCLRNAGGQLNVSPSMPQLKKKSYKRKCDFFKEMNVFINHFNFQEINVLSLPELQRAWIKSRD